MNANPFNSDYTPDCITSGSIQILNEHPPRRTFKPKPPMGFAAKPPMHPQTGPKPPVCKPKSMKGK